MLTFSAFSSIGIIYSDGPMRPSKSFNFCDTSTEVKHLIACFCSPLDLLIFSRLNSECRNIAFSHSLFQRNLGKIGAPALDSSFPFPGLIAFLFGTTPCWSCGKGIDTYPLSFALRIRVCNEQGKMNLYQDRPDSAHIFVTIPCEANRNGDDVLLEHIEPWAPFLEDSDKDEKIYSTRQLTSAISLLSDALKAHRAVAVVGTGRSPATLLLEEWSERSSELPALMKGSKRMLSWRKTYETAKRRYSSANEKIIKDICADFRLNKKLVMRSPTLLSTLGRYNRDLETLTFHAFAGIARVVESEVLDMKTGIAVVDFQRYPNAKTQCRFCVPAKPKRVYGAQDLLQHLLQMHPNDFPEAREELRTSASEMFCLLCPLSMRKYGVEGLAMHRAIKHK
ncbi:hypothetical protein B0H11DRAFT_2040895 [Mycena galericulata]|nr:hypothetical protein B0H11DRAFT_2040895 [Mycena galericulata]